MILEVILVRERPLVNVRPRVEEYGTQSQFDPLRREPFAIVRLPEHQRLVEDVDGALLATNIMSTCHQLHVEGAQLLYCRNIFQAEDAASVSYQQELWSPYEKVLLLHPAYATLVRRVRIHAGWASCRHQQTVFIRDVIRTL